MPFIPLIRSKRMSGFLLNSLLFSLIVDEIVTIAYIRALFGMLPAIGSVTGKRPII